MYKILEYLKYLGMFILIIVGIAIISSLINLTGLNSSFISKLSVILTALSFFIITCLASLKTQEKGIVLGLKLALIFVVLLILINLIFFRSGFNIDRLIYYIILIASGMLGGSFGKNIKTKQKK